MEHLECSRSTVERILEELRISGFDLVDAHHSGDDHRTKRWSLAREGLLSNPAAEQLLSLTLNERVALEQPFRCTTDAALKDRLSKVLALQASVSDCSWYANATTGILVNNSTAYMSKSS